jgi:hypothetical protein
MTQIYCLARRRVFPYPRTVTSKSAGRPIKFMNKKIFFIILISLLFSAGPSYAALQVPVGRALQPIPQDTGPSYDQNINSENNPYNKSQSTDQQQILQAPGTIPESNVTAPAPVTVPVADTVAVSSEPIIIYWILLIVGFLGLVGVLAWLYFRFRK